MINTKLQSIIDTKSAIGNAIVNKGGTITGETPFFNYAAQIDGISTGAGAYSNFVAQAQDNSKYTVYNGYDSQTNPTPNLSNNFPFNQWLLNNSATGDVVLSNVVVAVGGIYNGPNTTSNEASVPFINNTAVAYGGTIQSITTNNSFLYVAGYANQTIQKFSENNLTRISSSPNFGSAIINIITSNGFIYAGGFNTVIRQYYESNLSFFNSVSFGGEVYTFAKNNGFIYAGGSSIKKYHESNLTLSATSNASSGFNSITINNGFIYAGGFNNAVFKYHESNLAFVGNAVTYNGRINDLITNNGFIYAVGIDNGTHGRDIKKYHESNLVFDSNSARSTDDMRSIRINNGFIYAGGVENAKKYYESNLTSLNNITNFGIDRLTLNNGFLYVTVLANQTIQKFQQTGITPDNQTFYNITQIKEDI
jgi:hypothetical protein